MRHFKLLSLLVLLVFFATACVGGRGGRGIDSGTFGTNETVPTSFRCPTGNFESKLPPITPEADEIFKQARVLEKSGKLREGAELHKKAAAMGHWKAKYNLAVAYQDGVVTGRPDVKTAADLMAALAKDGVPVAYWALSYYAEAGYEGAPPSTLKARALRAKAADLGHTPAMLYFGLNYLLNSDPTWTAGKAALGRQYLECALTNGEGEAGYYLSAESIRSKNYQQSVEYLKRGATAGDLKSMNMLRLYARGGPVDNNNPTRFVPNENAEMALNIMLKELRSRPGATFPNFHSRYPGYTIQIDNNPAASPAPAEPGPAEPAPAPASTPPVKTLSAPSTPAVPVAPVTNPVN